MIFKTLAVSDYAQYAIIQSFSAICALAFTLNVDSSMQKVLSKPRVVPYAQLAYAGIVFLCSAAVITLVTIGLITIPGNIFFFPMGNTPPGLIIFFSLSMALNSYLQAYFNAIQKRFHYACSAMSYPCLLLLYLVGRGDSDLQEILSAAAFAYLSPIALLFRRYSLAKIAKLRFGTLYRVTLYILRYSIPSFPALGSKLSLEYVARQSIAQTSGYTAVSALAFATTVFSLFRSIEKAFFRAVSPRIISVKSTAQEERSMRLLLIIQTVACLIVFSLSYFWIGLLSLFFPEKPSAIFDYSLYVILGLTYAASLWKNYFMTFSKRRYRHIRLFFFHNNLPQYMWSWVFNDQGCDRV